MHGQSEAAPFDGSEPRPEMRKSLFASPSIAFVFAGSVLGRIAAAMISLGIVLLAQSVTGSFAVAGVATGAYTLASVVAGPARSSLIVKFGHRRVLIVLAIVAVLGLLSLTTFVSSPPGVVVTAALVGLASPPFGALLRISWSAVLPPRILPRAFGLDAVCEEVTFVVGLLLVGATALAGSHVPLVTSGVILLISALVMAPGLHDSQEKERVSVSVRSVARGTAPVLVALAGVGLTVGLVEVAIPAMAEDFGRIDLAGPLLAVNSAASAAGAFIYGRMRLRASHRTWMMRLGIATALGTGLLAAATNLMTLVGFLVVAGFAVGPAVLTGYLLADGLAARGDGRTHAAILASVACNGGTALGAAAAGLLVTASGAPAAILSIVGLAIILIIVGGAWTPAKSMER